MIEYIAIQCKNCVQKMKRKAKKKKVKKSSSLWSMHWIASILRLLLLLLICFSFIFTFQFFETVCFCSAFITAFCVGPLSYSVYLLRFIFLDLTNYSIWNYKIQYTITSKALYIAACVHLLRFFQCICAKAFVCVFFSISFPILHLLF